eukprot:6649132-Prymnesium_polylepis.1
MSPLRHMMCSVLPPHCLQRGAGMARAAAGRCDAALPDHQARRLHRRAAAHRRARRAAPRLARDAAWRHAAAGAARRAALARRTPRLLLRDPQDQVRAPPVGARALRRPRLRRGRRVRLRR